MKAQDLRNRAVLAHAFNCCESLRIIGGAHMPQLNPGDWVLVGLHENCFTVDGRYAVSFGGPVDVRWLTGLPGRLIPIACGNPALPDYVVEADHLEIVGRVLGTIRRC